jgi:hypothetical protein
MFFRRKSTEEIQKELYKNTRLVVHGEAHYDSKIKPPILPLLFPLSLPDVYFPWERIREPYSDSFKTQKWLIQTKNFHIALFESIPTFSEDYFHDNLRTALTQVLTYFGPHKQQFLENYQELLSRLHLSQMPTQATVFYDVLCKILRSGDISLIETLDKRLMRDLFQEKFERRIKDIKAHPQRGVIMKMLENKDVRVYGIKDLGDWLLADIFWIYAYEINPEFAHTRCWEEFMYAHQERNFVRNTKINIWLFYQQTKKKKIRGLEIVGFRHTEGLIKGLIKEGFNQKNITAIREV